VPDSQVATDEANATPEPKNIADKIKIFFIFISTFLCKQ